MTSDFTPKKKSNIRNRFKKTQCPTITEDIVNNQITIPHTMTEIEMNTLENLSSVDNQEG